MGVQIKPEDVKFNLLKSIVGYEREYRKRDKQSKAELKKRILSIPPNPKAKILGKKGFVVNFADLGNKWSVEYHDFGTQCKMLAEAVDKAESTLDAILRLRRALQDRRIVVDRATIPLHPALVTGLKKVLAA